MGTTRRIRTAAGIAALMADLSSANSFCFIEEVRRILDRTLTDLEIARVKQSERQLWEGKTESRSNSGVRYGDRGALEAHGIKWIG